MTTSRQLSAVYGAAQDRVVDVIDGFVSRRGFTIREGGVHTGRGVATFWTRTVPLRTDELWISFCWGRADGREVALGLSTSVPREDGKPLEIDAQNVSWLLHKRNTGPILREVDAQDGAPGVEPLLGQLGVDLQRALAWWEAHYGDEAHMLGRLRASDRNGVSTASDAGRALVERLEASLRRQGVDPASIAPAPIRES